MSEFVIDASVAVKWVVAEEGTQNAVELLSAGTLCAPDLLIAECANILWKKARLAQLSTEEALLAAELIERADVELYPMRALLQPATRFAIDLDHPAYDCIYLALAVARDAKFVTADARLISKVRGSSAPWTNQVLGLDDIPAELQRH